MRAASPAPSAVGDSPGSEVSTVAGFRRSAGRWWPGRAAATSSLQPNNIMSVCGEVCVRVEVCVCGEVCVSVEVCVRREVCLRAKCRSVRPHIYAEPDTHPAHTLQRDTHIHTAHTLHTHTHTYLRTWDRRSSARPARSARTAGVPSGGGSGLPPRGSEAGRGTAGAARC